MIIIILFSDASLRRSSFRGKSDWRRGCVQGGTNERERKEGGIIDNIPYGTCYIHLGWWRSSILHFTWLLACLIQTDLLERARLRFEWASDDVHWTFFFFHHGWHHLS